LTVDKRSWKTAAVFDKGNLEWRPAAKLKPETYPPNIWAAGTQIVVAKRNYLNVG
jgi:hypothetical protein